MKFKIRYADQIVGTFSLVAIVGLVALVFAIGSGQKWFTKKLRYYTMFESGAGLSVGMNITYKGFNIGKVRTITLDQQQDRVRVDYYILADYQDYIKEFTLVQFATSPIGLGAKFELLPGSGARLLAENSEIFRADTAEGEDIRASGGNVNSMQTDSIGLLMGQVGTLLDNVNELLKQVNEGVAGSAENRVGELLANVVAITASLNDLISSIDGLDAAVPTLLGPDIAREIQHILANLNHMTASLGDLDSAVPKLLGPSMTKDLEGVLGSVNKLASGATPQVNDLLKELERTLNELQDVLTGVKNNPLIRGGVPDRSRSTPSTLHVRDGNF